MGSNPTGPVPNCQKKPGKGFFPGTDRRETIFVYDESEELALETLKHEFLDYAISKVIEPYKNVTNKLIMLINEEAYRRKEKLIESLTNYI
ncbi:MAG: hypothetical protein QW220_02390 [Candidatus Bathyarchaeia archaeon]